MSRQLFLVFLTLFLTPPKVWSKPPTDSTITVPSPPDKHDEEKPRPESETPEQVGGVLESTQDQPRSAPLYHLNPRPSLTLALSRAHEFESNNHGGWIGMHVAPWMTATTRIQFV